MSDERADAMEREWLDFKRRWDAAHPRRADAIPEAAVNAMVEDFLPRYVHKWATLPNQWEHRDWWRREFGRLLAVAAPHMAGGGEAERYDVWLCQTHGITTSDRPKRRVNQTRTSFEVEPCWDCRKATLVELRAAQPERREAAT